MSSANEVRREIWRSRVVAVGGYLVGSGLLAFVVTTLGGALGAGPTVGRRGLVLLLAGVLVLLAGAAVWGARTAWRRGVWLLNLEREWVLQERRRELGIEPDVGDDVLREIQREKLALARGRGWRIPSRDEVRAIEARCRARATT
jgi:hypothetical protein